MQLLPGAANPVVAAILRKFMPWNCCHARKNLWRLARGGCNLRLQYMCGKLCNCCYKRENLRWLQYTGAGNYATAVTRGKPCGGYNISVVNYATAALQGKACDGCSTSAGNYATGAMRGKNCDGCKRGNTRKLPMQTYDLFQEWEARSCLDMFAQNCLDLGGCVWDILSHFLSTSSNCD